MRHRNKRKDWYWKDCVQENEECANKQSYMFRNRKTAVKTYVFSTLLYGCEAWTVSKDMEQRLEAMKMWCWRRMMRVSWTERRSNANILETIGGRRELLATVRKRQMAAEVEEGLE